MSATDLEEPAQEVTVESLAAPLEGRESLLSRIFASHPNKLAVLVCSTLFLLAVGYFDWLTAPEIHLPLLYLIPPAVVTWFVGRKVGYPFAIISAFTQLAAEVIRTDVYTHPSTAYWNTASRIVFLMFLVTMIAALRQLSLRLGIMVEMRTQALRHLAAQLSETEENERRRLANDIHDSLSQTLSMLKLSLSAALAEKPIDAPSRQHIVTSLATVNELIEKTRTLMFDLYPAMLEHLGLWQTLRHFGEEFERQTGIEITVNEEGQPQSPPRTTANYLFRSTKELVNNAAKHGRAKQIVVSLHWTAASIRVVVDDDGSGFDPMQMNAAQKAKGLGLAAIHERLLSLGGSVRIESSVGKGTRVVLQAPLAAREAA